MSKAKGMGINMERAISYPWEVAGWYWSKLKKINSKINENPNFSAEEVTQMVNERKKAYEKCCEKIKK